MAGPFCFAWAGGAIAPQTTLVTNGTTHGVSFESFAIVGEVAAGEQQLINMASASRLEVNGYYEVSGPGLGPGTRFLYDNTILSGLPGSVNLSAAGGSGPSATFTVTKSVSVGVALGNFAGGSSVVTLTDTGELPAGTYVVFGASMETDAPIGTTDGTSHTSGGGIMIIDAAYLVYDGVTTGTMLIYAATPHTTTGEDEFGQATTLTTYTVAAQEVRATASGQYPLQFMGFPTANPTLISDIPATALGSLEPGLTYNITGNGIEHGTTFVAPLGGTSITLDTDATASDLDAILTISGPRTPNAPFDPAVHNRFDEEVLSLEITQEEGGFAMLAVDLRNPNVGLLAVGRNLWAWLSWDQNWTPGGAATPSLLPVFNGRLVGVPKLTANETVRLEFLARPDDLNVQKTALADSLKVLPYYDPVWLASSQTADTVLEAYSALWHIDRTTLTMTISDILEGDSIIEIGEDKSIYDRFSLGYSQPPLVATTVSGTVSWQQQGEGVIDVTQVLLDAFYKAGSGYRIVYPTGRGTSPGRFTGLAGSGISGLFNMPYSTLGMYTVAGSTKIQQVQWNTGGGGLIQTLGDGGIAAAWPAAGTNIGGGWSLSNLTDMEGVPLCYLIEATSDKGGWLKPMTYTVTYTAPLAVDEEDTAGAGGIWGSNSFQVTQQYGTYNMNFPVNAYKIRMNLEYRANRPRSETVTAVLAAGVQQELSDSAESDRETISLTSQFVDQGVDPGGELPIGDVSYRSYFQTARGAASFEYLLLAARAKMRARARAVDIGFTVDWATALPITLRHSVRYTDRRVPGGEAIGKVKSYKLAVAGGTMLGEFVIGCSIGEGTTTDPQLGVNSYVESDYADDPWQIVAGAQAALISGDVYYQTLDDFVIADDGLDLANITPSRAVNTCIVVNGLTDQLRALDAYQDKVFPMGGDPGTTIKRMTTSVTLDLVPVTGAEYHTAFFPAVTPLALPKTIDLAAPVPGD